MHGVFNILAFPAQLMAVLLGIPGWHAPNAEEECAKEMELARQQDLCNLIKPFSEDLALQMFYFKDVPLREKLSKSEK